MDEYMAERKALVDDHMARYRALIDEYLAAIAAVDNRYLPRVARAHTDMIAALVALDRRWVESGRIFDASAGTKDA